MEHEDKELLQEYAKRSEMLDQIDPATPAFDYFKVMVDRQQLKAKRAQKLQLVLFVIVALTLVSAVMLLTGKFEIIFLSMQGAAFTGAILGLAVFFHKTRRRGEGAH